MRLFCFISTLLLCGSVYSQTLITNIKGTTVLETGEVVQFSELAFDGDTISAIGDNLARANIKTVIDGKGHFMLPGIIDAHGHLLELGQTLMVVELRGAQSEAEAAKRVASFVARTNGDDWLIGRGWNQVLWPNQTFPTKASLDALNIDRPIVLERIDGHAIWVNSKALELAGITAQTTSPSGGEIVKDAKGQPTGLLIDNAMYMVQKLIPPASDEARLQKLAIAGEHLLSLGITSMHDAGISHAVAQFYQAQAKANALPVRVYAMLSATDPKLPEMLAQGHVEDSAGMLSIRSVKAYGDGALGSRGAALLAPYSDDPHNHGLLVTAAEYMPVLFDQVIGADFQLNYHAIGDRANRLGLEHFAKSFATHEDNTERHRIEHAQIVNVDDLALFAIYNVIASMQPTHATSDKNMAEDRLGKARLKGAYAWQTLLQSGSRIAFGSDFPVELANPFHGIYAAVTRQDKELEPEGGWLSHEAVTRAQALKGFTLDGAYAAFQDTMIGSLEVGKKADFILVDRDIMTVPSREIYDTQVLQTWINGELRYQAQ